MNRRPNLATLALAALLASAGLAGANDTPNFDGLSLRKVPQARQIVRTAVLDFGSASGNACSADLTVVVAGAAAGDAVSVAAPAASVNTGSTFSGWVSAADTVKARHCNTSGSSNDPASGTYSIIVSHFDAAPVAAPTPTATATNTPAPTATTAPTATPTP